MLLRVRQPSHAAHREERDEVHEVAVLDELAWREPEVERRHLEDEERDEDREQRGERMGLPAARMECRRHEPGDGQRDRQDPDPERHLVEMGGRRVPEAVRHEVAVERQRVVPDDAAEAADRGEQRRQHEPGGVGGREHAMAGECIDCRPSQRERASISRSSRAVMFLL